VGIAKQTQNLLDLSYTQLNLKWVPSLLLHLVIVICYSFEDVGLLCAVQPNRVLTM